jgi:hypothetical protein
MTIEIVKGEIMKMQCLRILMVLVGFAGLSFTAAAQVADQLVVNIPFAFSVAGKTLAAGTYKVNRIDDDKSDGLMLRSFENRDGGMFFPTYVENTPSNKPKLSFEKVGNQYFLSKIETRDSTFIIPASRVAVLEASARSNAGTPSGTSSGGN